MDAVMAHWKTPLIYRTVELTKSKARTTRKETKLQSWHLQMVFVVYLVEASPFWDKKRKTQPGGWSANFYDSFVKARVTFNSRDTSSTRDRPKFWQTWTFSDCLMIVSLSETDKFSKTNRQSGWLRRECWLISITWPIDPSGWWAAARV